MPHVGWDRHDLGIATPDKLSVHHLAAAARGSGRARLRVNSYHSPAPKIYIRNASSGSTSEVRVRGPRGTSRSSGRLRARRLGHLVSRGSRRSCARRRWPVSRHYAMPLRPPRSRPAGALPRPSGSPSPGRAHSSEGWSTDPAAPTVPASSDAPPPTIESPCVMRARGFVQLVLSAMLDARRIRA